MTNGYLNEWIFWLEQVATLVGWVGAIAVMTLVTLCMLVLIVALFWVTVTGKIFEDDKDKHNETR